MDLINGQIEPGVGSQDKVPRYLLRYRAYIVSNKDKEKFGRVKVWVPDLFTGEPSEDNSIWARPKNNTLGGRNFVPKMNKGYTFQGSLYVPVPKTWWWVVFENGDPNRCFYTDPCDIENWIAPPECLLGNQWYNKWEIMRSPQHRVIIISDDPDDCRVEITGMKRGESGTEVADENFIKDYLSEHVNRINTKQKTILIDEREGHNKILFADEKGNYINIWTEENHIYIHSMADTRVYAEKKLYLESLEECHVKCQKNIFMHAEYNSAHDDADSGNIHIKADKSIFMEAGEDINITAHRDIFVKSDNDTHVLVDNDFYRESKNDTNITCHGKHVETTDGDCDVTCKANMKQTVNQNYDLKVGQTYSNTSSNKHTKAINNINTESGVSMNIKAGQSLIQSAGLLFSAIGASAKISATGQVSLSAGSNVAIDGAAGTLIDSGEATSGPTAVGANDAAVAALSKEALEAIAAKLAEKVEMHGSRNETPKWKNFYDQNSTDAHIYDPSDHDYPKSPGDDSIINHLKKMEKGKKE